MDLVQLASHPAVGLALALAVITGLCAAVTALWKQLQQERAEVRRVYELNRQLCNAALLVGLERRPRGDLAEAGPSAQTTGEQPAEHTPGGGRGPDQGGRESA